MSPVLVISPFVRSQRAGHPYHLQGELPHPQPDCCWFCIPTQDVRYGHTKCQFQQEAKDIDRAKHTGTAFLVLLGIIIIISSSSIVIDLGCCSTAVSG